ncbi:hypothetical protein [Corynebacterium sp. HMSC29G08]|uniref:hypothetical protein n=1 Tax=Corynebacterium sp. HMSC29G08 TaxID=1581069 RepID=UPI001438FD9D|nr:hypothetical protein [Corynebacterium sp. HMSC29G08]
MRRFDMGDEQRQRPQDECATESTDEPPDRWPHRVRAAGESIDDPDQRQQRNGTGQAAENLQQQGDGDGDGHRPEDVPNGVPRVRVAPLGRLADSLVAVVGSSVTSDTVLSSQTMTVILTLG